MNAELSTLVRNFGDVFCFPLRNSSEAFLAEFGKECDQIPSAEGLLEWRGDFLVALLETEQAFFQVGQRGEIVGDKDLPLNDREVDLDLIEPAGVNGGYGREPSWATWIEDVPQPSRRDVPQ